MMARTIAGDIRRLRRNLVAHEGRVVVAMDYGDLLKLFDAIETKAKRMQDALKPVLQCPVCADFSPERQASFCMNAVADAIHIYNGGEK